MFHVAFCADKKFLPYAAVAINSLLEAHQGKDITVHLLAPEEDIQDRCVAEIGVLVERRGQRVCKYGVRIQKLAPVQMDLRFTPAALLRMVAPEHLQVERFTYLDSDLVVVDDLEELFEMDLDDKVIGAAMELSYASKSVREAHGIDEYFQLLGLSVTPGEYFNSGVLVVDTAKWNEERVTERCLEALSSTKQRLKHGDQDILNIVLAGRWKELPVRFNCAQNIWPILARGEDFADDQIYLERRCDLERARCRPAIVHYVGRKPWQEDYYEHVRAYPHTLTWRREARKVPIAGKYRHSSLVIWDWKCRQWTSKHPWVRWVYFGIRKRVRSVANGLMRR